MAPLTLILATCLADIYSTTPGPSIQTYLLQRGVLIRPLIENNNAFEASHWNPQTREHTQIGVFTHAKLIVAFRPVWAADPIFRRLRILVLETPCEVNTSAFLPWHF